MEGKFLKSEKNTFKIILTLPNINTLPQTSKVSTPTHIINQRKIKFR